jgi:hypothetical protein
MTWIREFDESYAVPDCITQAEGIRDISWHNDVCPSFDVPLGKLMHALTIWADHPDLEKRELPGPRFSVAYLDYDKDDDDPSGPFGSWEVNGGILLETDDETLVIPEYLRLLKVYRQWKSGEATFPKGKKEQ